MRFVRNLSSFIRSREVCTFAFQFPPDFENSSFVKATLTGTLPVEHAVWVWDLFYAKVLYTISDGSVSRQLKDHLEQWAEPLAAGLGFPIEAAEGMDLLKLDKTLRLTHEELDNPDTYTLRVLQAPQMMPYIRTKLPKRGYQNRLAYSVVVFAQHLINHNKLLAKDLAINILSLRKYYRDIRSYSDLASTNGAPLFALKESTEIYRELSNELGDVSDKSQ